MLERTLVRGGERLFLAFFHGGHVGADDAPGIAGGARNAVVDPQRFVTEALDEPQRMRHEQDGLAAPAELREFIEALVGKAFVAYREDLVHEQHVGIDVDRHGKPEAHVHPGRIRLHRRVDEGRELRELDDLVEPPRDLALGQTQHDAVDEDVLAARNFGMESGAELDERRDAPTHGDPSRRRPGDAGDALEHRALARPIAADDSVGTAGRHREADAFERLERVFRAEVADETAGDERALERGELALVRVPPVDLRDVNGFDRGVCSGHYTSSANESRSRSKTK